MPDNPPYADMVWIAGGTFRMGSGDFYPEERPVHEVKVDGFWMDRCVVTNAQFECFVVVRRACLIILTLFALSSIVTLRAQPYDVPATWGGDILSRPRLTGDWGGLRDELGKKGVVLDVDLLMTPQVNVSGGRSTGGNFWGNLDYTLKPRYPEDGAVAGRFL